MNNIRWTKQFMAVLLTFGAFAGPISAEEEIKQSPKQQDDECSQEILLSYYPAVFVKETLKKFNVPEDKWEAINKELGTRDKEIIKIVESKAAKVNPNPLKDPQQRQAAVKLFRETLVDNFGAVMKAHGVTDDKQIQEMLDDVQQQKARRFAHCMQQQKQKMGMSGPAAEDDDYDDEDDDDYEDDEG